MNLRDIKLAQGALQELYGYLRLNTQKNKVFLSQLKEHRFTPKLIAKSEAQFNRIHRTIKKDLEIGYALAIESEELIKEGNNPAKELNKIIPYLVSFDKSIFDSKKGHKIRFGLKSECDYLTELLEKAEEEGFGEDVLNLIKNRVTSVHKLAEDQRFKEIKDLRSKLVYKSSDYFKLKFNWIDFNRPKINEVLTIGSSTVYLEIYFDKDLTNKDIKKLLKNHIFLLSKCLDISLDKNPENSVFVKMKSRIEQKAKEINNQNIKVIEEIWLQQLKQMFIDILEKNPDLILTPSFRYQVKITTDQHNLTAFCDHQTRIDHYLFGLEISTLVIMYLVGENFYEGFPASLFNQLKGTTAQRKMISPQENIIPNADQIDRSLSKIYQATQNYRTFSLYNVYNHETEHAFDRKYLFKANKLRSLVNYLIVSSSFYKNHKTTNLGPELLALADFYFMCRQEAPPQFREFLVNHEAELEKNKAYSLINPIFTLGNRNLIQEVNEVIMGLMNKSKSEEIISKRHYEFGGLGYPLSHFMNMVIFFADCKRNNVNLTILDTNSLNKLIMIFPDATQILTGHTKIKEFPEGTPEWFLLNSIKEGTTNQFLEILRTNKIPRYSLNDIPQLIHHNIPFYIFRPSVDAMKVTLRKIQHSDEVTYFDLYTKSCDLLKIPESDRLLSIRRIKGFIEHVYRANAILAKESKFHP